MAESLVVSVLLPLIFDKLASRIVQEFGRVLGVKEDLHRLESTFLTIKDVLEDAESRSIKEKPLHNWLAKLKDMTYDVEDLLDYIQMEADRRKLEIHGHMIKKISCFFSRSNPIIFRFKISHRVKEMRERLDEISAERSKFHLEKREAKDWKMEVEERETWSKLDEKNICGRDEDIETIVSFLMETNNEEHVSILPIVGMGGLGKTTLAQLIYNDERVEKEQFEMRIWVYVSVLFDTKKIARDAISSATGQNCNHDNLDSIGNQLEEILRGKKFLLVLDDVWNENEDEWEKLKLILNVGSRESRIIVTTRSEKVASIMGNTTPYNLKGLSNDDCWNLFKQRAFGKESEEENPHLVKIGKEIVKKCGGVPLAAKTLGSIMRFKKEEEDWLAMRDNNFWKLTEQGDRIIASLRLSYNHLPPCAKQCFAYCSLFPKGYEFDKDTLISQWIAQGFVRSIDGSPQMESIANTYFNDLAWMSFLQDMKDDIYSGKVTCKMHDLVHDLAGSVAGDEFLVEEAEKAGTYLAKGCRYVALMSNNPSTEVRANSIKRVRALHFFDTSKKCRSREFSGSILSSAKCLRTLDLSDGRIKSLPKLSNLRYLRASIAQDKMLSEYICGFRNLQSLHRSGCNDLRTLPESIGDLRNLRNLKLIGCGSIFQQFPDSFGNLEHLLSLDLSDARMELLPIKFFGGLQNLQSINLSQCKNLKELSESIGDAKNLRSIVLSWCENLKGLPDSIGEAKNLRNLNMERCRRLQTLPESMSNLTRLESLNLDHCEELQELPRGLGNMRNLKHLNTEGCYSLRGMPRDMRQLINLRTLPRFVVGKEEDDKFSSIGELEHLNHLEGELRIEYLGRARIPTDAMKVNLKEKRNLHYLVLSWNDHWREEERDGDIEGGVLECLQPPPSIKMLEIHGYMGAKNPSWLGEKGSAASLPNLSRLRLNYVKRIDRMPQLEQFSSLKYLEITGMHGIRHMGGNAALFPSLEELVFCYNQNLEKWRTTTARGEATLFPRLAKLRIDGCPKLKARPWIPASVEDLSIRATSDEEWLSETSLRAASSGFRYLSIWRCGASYTQWMGLQHLASSLQVLTIIECRKLRRLPESISHLASLRSLYLSSCEDLSALPKWAVGELPSLRSLHITKCPSLTSLPNGMRHLALDELYIYDCPRLTERCQRERGEDWHIIARIPFVSIQ